MTQAHRREYVFNDRTFLWKIQELEKGNLPFLLSAVLEIILPSTVLLQVYLNESKSLIELPEGSSLEIQYVKIGRPDVYENGLPIFNFDGCVIEEISIPDPVTFGSGAETRPLFVNIAISCVIEINWENLDIVAEAEA